VSEAARVRGLIAVAIALALAGCGYREPGMSSADAQAFAADHPGILQTCVDDVRWGRRHWGDVVHDSECFEMLPPQRWSGLWEHGWEWTNFCPDAANECNWMSKRGTWLTFANGAYPNVSLPDGTYHIEFVGRRTKMPGYFGHLDDYDHLMVVDRLISIKLQKEEPGG
jgi:hypothetical protein